MPNEKGRPMTLRMPASLKIPESEYRANLNGLNIFFGAVLGFVIAGVERLNTIQFSWVLFVVSVVVISILYVSASKQRFTYAFVTLFLILGLPTFVRPVVGADYELPNQLQPTLAMWAILAIALELFRRPSDELDSKLPISPDEGAGGTG